MAKDDTVVDVRSAVEAVSAEDDAPLHQIESLCMRCGENTGALRLRIFLLLRLDVFHYPNSGCHVEQGITRLLLTRIPHFREYAEARVPLGMLNRQVVKSDLATIKIPELEFEIPPEAQRGTLSTVEGILTRAADELMALQDERKKVDPQTAEAIDQFVAKLKSFAAGCVPFTFILDDPSGNSFIENLFAPSADPSLLIKFYDRTPEQQASMGFLADSSSHGGELDTQIGNEAESNERHHDGLNGEPHGSVGAVAGHRAFAQGNSEEVAAAFFKYSAPEEEPPLFSIMSEIPYFQEVIVMASTCDACGYRSSELKPGGQIPAKGKKITIHVQSIDDLCRDVIKSDTASVKVPELELELASGTLGGVVTTVEGLVTKISESHDYVVCMHFVVTVYSSQYRPDLERVQSFSFGDSLDDWKRNKWQDFKSRLTKLVKAEEPWTLIIDDALANSFVAPKTDAIENDHQLVFEEYERSWEQNEELGLNDMDTSSADVAYNSAT
ncbi:hypothetical protein ACLOJK_011766 [Asimina triloba]